MKNPIKSAINAIRALVTDTPEKSWKRGCAAAMVHRTFPEFNYHLDAEAESASNPAFALGWAWGLDMPLAVSLPASIKKELRALK